MIGGNDRLSLDGMTLFTQYQPPLNYPYPDLIPATYPSTLSFQYLHFLLSHLSLSISLSLSLSIYLSLPSLIVSLCIGLHTTLSSYSIHFIPKLLAAHPLIIISTLEEGAVLHNDGLSPYFIYPD